MRSHCLFALCCALALAACGRSADPALQISADGKGSVIVTGTLGDERSRHDLALAFGQALASNGKGGNVNIVVDNTVKLVEWPRKLQDAIPVLTGIADVQFTVLSNTVTLTGTLSPEEKRSLLAALQTAFGAGYVITVTPKAAPEPAVAVVPADPLADQPIDPDSLVHAWSVDVTTPLTRKTRTASDPRAGFTLSYTLADKPRPLANDEAGKFELDNGVICTLGAAVDRERYSDGRMLNETVRFIDCPGATIDGGPSAEIKEDNAAGCTHVKDRPVFSTERHTRRFIVLRGIIQVGSLFVECRPQRTTAEAPMKSDLSTQREGMIAAPAGAAPK